MNDEINRKWTDARKKVMMTRVMLERLSDAFSATGNHDLATKLAHMSMNLIEAIQTSDKAQNDALALYVAAVDKGSATMLATALAMAGRKPDAEGK